MQGLRFAIAVIVSIWSFLGSGEIARASDLRLKFVNSDKKAPYFPIHEIKISKSEISFDYQEVGGPPRHVKIAAKVVEPGPGKKKELMFVIEDCLKISPQKVIDKREARGVKMPKKFRCAEPIKAGLDSNYATIYPISGPSAMRFLFEKPDSDLKENAGQYNLVIKRAGKRMPNVYGVSEDHDHFEQDPAYRIQFAKKGHALIPSKVTRVSYDIHPESGDTLKTKIVPLKQSFVQTDGSLGWSRRIPPNNKIDISDRSYVSSKWPVNDDGSIVTPQGPLFGPNANSLKMDANDQRALQPPASSEPPAPPAAK
ncbi:MAG: hypothetical protein JNM39_11260 [Bdellovibrionaceae bacterium]|nr:hypothetical protein [Pseudobdellovibrionaceae bacterium]